MHAPSSPASTRRGTSIHASPSQRAAASTRKSTSTFGQHVLSTSAPSSPAKPRTQGFVPRASAPPNPDTSWDLLVLGHDVRPARQAYSATVNAEREREARSSQRQQQQQRMSRLTPATDASRGVGASQTRRSQSDAQARQSSQQQRYSAHLEPAYEDEEEAPPSQSFRRTTSGSARSVSQSFSRSTSGAQRLRPSIVTTDGRVNEMAFEDRCTMLAKLAGNVLQFYEGLVQDGFGPKAIEDMQREWKTFEVFKTNQLMASSNYHQHFIDASEVQASHQLQRAPDYFLSAITLANRATFVHYVWGIPDDCAIDALRKGTYEHRALTQLLETKRVFMTWIVPSEQAITDDVLALLVDLSTQVYIALRRADYDLPREMHKRAQDYLDSALDPESLRAALFRAKKNRELSGKDIEAIIQRYETFVEARTQQIKLLDDDPRAMGQEWSLRSTGADICAYVAHIDASDEPPPQCSSSLQALYEMLERQEVPDASREIMEDDAQSEQEGSQFEYEVQQSARLSGGGTAAGGSQMPRQSTPSRGGKEQKQESYQATKTQQQRWLDEFDDSKEAGQPYADEDDSGEALSQIELAKEQRLDLLAAVAATEVGNDTAEQLAARIAATESRDVSAALTPRTKSRGGAIASAAAEQKTPSRIMEDIRSASVRRSGGASAQPEKRRNDSGAAEDEGDGTPTQTTTARERLIFDSQKRLKRTTATAPLGILSRGASGKGERLSRFDDDDDEAGADIFLEQQQGQTPKRNNAAGAGKGRKLDKGKARAVDPRSPSPSPTPKKRRTRAAARSQSRDASEAPSAAARRVTRSQLRTAGRGEEAGATEDEGEENDENDARRVASRGGGKAAARRALERVEEDDDQPMMPELDEAPEFIEEDNMDIDADLESEVARAAPSLRDEARAPRPSGRAERARIPASSMALDDAPPNNQQALSESGLYEDGRAARRMRASNDEDEEMELTQAEIDRQNEATAAARRKRMSNSARPGFLNIRPPRAMSEDEEEPQEEEQEAPPRPSQPGPSVGFTRSALLNYSDPARSGAAAEALRSADGRLKAALAKRNAIGLVVKRIQDLSAAARDKEEETERMEELTERAERHGKRLERRELRRAAREEGRQTSDTSEAGSEEEGDEAAVQEIAELVEEEATQNKRASRERMIWTNAEVDVFLRALDKHAKRRLVRGEFQPYRTILDVHGPNGDGKLARWNNKQLKDKAINLLNAMYRDGDPMPYWRVALFTHSYSKLKTRNWPKTLSERLEDQLKQEARVLEAQYGEERNKDKTYKGNKGQKRKAEQGDDDEEEEDEGSQQEAEGSRRDQDEESQGEAEAAAPPPAAPEAEEPEPEQPRASRAKPRSRASVKKAKARAQADDEEEEDERDSDADAGADADAEAEAGPSSKRNKAARSGAKAAAPPRKDGRARRGEGGRARQPRDSEAAEAESQL